MLHLWVFIFCRVLLAIVPFACHYLKGYQDAQAKTPLQLEQRVTVRQQPNQVLAELSGRFSWPGQQQAPSLQSAPDTQKLAAATPPPAHDPPPILAGPSPLPIAPSELGVARASQPPLPPTWCGSLAYFAQAPPSQA